MKNFNLDREQALFLFIDYQEGFLKIVDQKERLMKNAKILANTSSIMNIPSIFTLQYRKGLGDTAKELREILPNVAEYDKVTFSAMLNEDISNAVKASGRKQIILSGIETHICVLTTARDLLRAGYEVFLVSDSVASRFNFNYENALLQIKDMGAVITNTETVLFDLNVKAGTEDFKKVQNLIK